MIGKGERVLGGPGPLVVTWEEGVGVLAGALRIPQRRVRVACAACFLEEGIPRASSATVEGVGGRLLSKL